MSNSTSNNYHHTTKNLSHRSNPCMQFRFWQLAIIIIIMRLYYIYIAKRVREAPFNRHPPPPKRTSWMALKISRFRGAWRSYTSQYLQQLLRSFEWVNFSCPERNGETVALEGPLYQSLPSIVIINTIIIDTTRWNTFLGWGGNCSFLPFPLLH